VIAENAKDKELIQNALFIAGRRQERKLPILTF
jgi:hypothetical protein